MTTTPALMPAILLAVMKNQPAPLKDRHYPGWHLAPVSGLMNDPNGFIQHNGRYHLFYQWNPLSCDHKVKCWGHWSSADLLNWQHEPIALVPGDEFDRDGCYSGSAVDNHGKLTLCYTGNVEFEDGTRTAWQCLAVQNDHGGFDKKGAVIPLPEGYTGHVRDPKVWKHNGIWYMVLGAQDLTLQGKVLLFRSSDLMSWGSLGEVAGGNLGGLGDAGYMWECPDLFAIGNETFLICCPQGVVPDKKRYLNPHPSAYLAGSFDHSTGSYQHGELHEIDAGFEFYAPQTTLANDGRRLLVGWMGVPDGEEMLQPTTEAKWIHQMTCVRELSARDGRLYQLPAAELQQLRFGEKVYHGSADYAPTLDARRIEILLEAESGVTIDFAETLALEWDKDELRLARRSLETGEWQYRCWCGKAFKLQILCDHSSIEIFINDGEGVMSSRYFPRDRARITFAGHASIKLQYWKLKPCRIK
ncbi:sucrose-6-phosphate hydrolase [Erwinia billingiae]|uniref:sucrose-6-phosphate hydrolase n=1 Tax=Erwinia billingiae TaxID=182337 RepID=UPI003208369A